MKSPRAGEISIVVAGKSAKQPENSWHPESSFVCDFNFGRDLAKSGQLFLQKQPHQITDKKNKNKKMAVVVHFDNTLAHAAA